MPNLGDAFIGLFYSLILAIGAAVMLAVYVIWQAIFGSTHWDVCMKMDTDSAKVQCMEAHYE